MPAFHSRALKLEIVASKRSKNWKYTFVHAVCSHPVHWDGKGTGFPKYSFQFSPESEYEKRERELYFSYENENSRYYIKSNFGSISFNCTRERLNESIFLVHHVYGDFHIWIIYIYI